jgi:hypothetical protein
MQGPWGTTTPAMRAPVVSPAEAHAAGRHALPLSRRKEDLKALKECIDDIDQCGGAAQASVHRTPSVRMFMEQVGRRAMHRHVACMQAGRERERASAACESGTVSPTSWRWLEAGLVGRSPV